MNCLIFQTAAEAQRLPRYDRRVKHLTKVLRLEPGGQFLGAVVDDYLGRFEFLGITAGQAQFELVAKLPPPPPALPGVELAIGYCRPLILKRVFRDGAAMGLKSFRVFATDLGDPSYSQSGYLSEGRYTEQFVAGLEQSGDFVMPALRHGAGLSEALAAECSGRVTLVVDRLGSEFDAAFGAHAEQAEPAEHKTYHNHSKSQNPYLSDWLAALARPVALRLIVGSERGFSLREKRLFVNAHHVVTCRLGPQMVRADTAALAALSSVWQRFAALSGR